MRKIWSNGSTPKKGSPVEVILDTGTRILGYYAGFNEEKDFYILMQNSADCRNVANVYRRHIKEAVILKN